MSENDIPVSALEGFELDTLTRTYIWFRHDVGVVDSNYMDNRAALASIREALSAIDSNSLKNISSILVEGAASPIGQELYNLGLSYRRAKTVADFLKSIPDIDSGGLPIEVVAKGEDWDAFTDDIRQNYQRRNRQELLEILESDLPNSEKKNLLRTMEPDSLTWRILIRDNMNTSRHAMAIVVVKKKRIVEQLPQLEPIKGPLETGAKLIDTIPPSPLPAPPPVTPTVTALKTNLLNDAVTALNFSLEFPINEKFSLLYQQNTPWWSAGNRFCLQFLSYGGEFRWWFAPKPQPAHHGIKRRDALTGHFVGLNAWSGIGDFQIGRKIGCYQFDFWSVGLTYGWAVPIGRYLNLELSVSAGYANIPYEHYIPTEDWSYLIKDNNNAGRLHYIGPTKAEVSLVLPIRVKTGGRK